MTDIKNIEALHYETGKPVRIEIDNGLIKNISSTGSFTDKIIDDFVAPGFIDNQVNGYTGVDFSEDEITVQSVKRVIEALNKEGVTSFVPTFITNSHEKLIHNFRNAASVLNDHFIKDSVAGFHLEGPYISPDKGYYGTHRAEFVRKPSWDEFLAYQEAAEGRIIEVTVAPEVEGAMDFISSCSKNNIHVSIGHSNATSDQINEAVSRGARLATHLGNGLANMIDRHRNPIWPILANELLSPSVIADGNHLLPDQIKVFFRIKGPGNIFLVSDASPLAGLPPGRYDYMGSEVMSMPDGSLRNLQMNCLAGASLPLKKGVENMMAFTGCSLATAINLASVNVSHILGFADRGELLPRRRADLVVFSFKEGKINITRTLVKGRQTFKHELKKDTRDK